MIHEQSKPKTSIYRKLNIIGIKTHFNSFLLYLPT